MHRRMKSKQYISYYFFFTELEENSFNISLQVVIKSFNLTFTSSLLLVSCARTVPETGAYRGLILFPGLGFYRGVTGMLQWYYRDIRGGLHRCYRVVTGVLWGTYKGVLGVL